MAAKKGRDFWQRFLAAHKRSGKSLADYCKAKGVSYKTARNWSSKLAKEGEQGQGQQGQGQPQGQGHSEPPGNRANTGDADQKKSQTAPGDQEPDPPRKKKEPHPNSLANLMPIQRGEQRALKHGGYARYFSPDLTDACNSELPAAQRLDTLIELTDLRLRSVLKHRAEWDAKADYGELTHDDYRLEEVTVKETFEGDETTRKRVRPPFEQLIDALTGRMGWLIAEKHRIERHLDVTAGDAAAQRAEIMQRAEDEGWSASDTGMEIEKLGLEVPFTLQQRIRAELALIEPPEPEGGVSDDELEALSAEYAEQIANEDTWLEQRRAEVEVIHKAKEAEKKGD